ncbi:MAG: hypothetical protein ABI668_08360 [Sphingorhabdus sp.]
MSDKPSETVSEFAKETARFRTELSKGRSAIQLLLFDLLVERSTDHRAPKEVEIALALFGADGLKDATLDSGVRVYVHRLRKRFDDFYRDKSGPRLVIPKGEYRIILSKTNPALPSSISPVLGVGLSMIAFGLALFMIWFMSPASPSTTGLNRKGSALEALLNISDPIIAVGDRLLIAETEDQRSVQRMILHPDIASREDLGRYLKTHPETFYRLFDFNLRLAPASSVAAAWELQGQSGDQMAGQTRRETILPISVLTDDMLKSRDVIYVGRISNLGPLTRSVFAKSRFRLSAYNQLTDDANGRVYSADVYSESEQSPRVDYGYIAVFPSPNGGTIVILSGLGDQATLAMTEFVSKPGEIATTRTRLGNRRSFEALFEIRSHKGLSTDRRLLVSRPLL